ncbi:MAG: 2-amino-4-hydroxy-6-hydroxymethyldihydropteridine diphosphokinase [Magnetococcus sp. DMHC-1]|nr:2-amino-4-hydroxy-6-hydroxymethyldihydropteridine diphosphokinase [Magnetococcales bacterium]
MNRTTLGPALVAFGANLDPLPNLIHGLRRCQQELGVRALSTVYRTKPVGLVEQPDFLNGAILLERSLDPWLLRKLLRKIESECSRRRDPHAPNGPRTLDLDIALLGEVVLEHEHLVIPDPNILQWPFLALPLAELMPNLIHPRIGKSLAAIAADFGPTPPNMQIDQEATNTLQRLIFPEKLS